MQRLRCHTDPLGRPLRRLRRLEQHLRRSAARCAAARPREGQGPGHRFPAARRAGRRARPAALRDRRDRQGRGRGFRAGLGRPARGRPRHRQVDAAPAGCGGACRARWADRLLLGRGGPGADPHARRAPRPRRRAGGAGCGHRRPRYRDERRGRDAARHGGDRFHPDHVSRHPRFCAGDGRPGAGLRPGADPARQAHRHGARARGPRHQGGADRRPPRARAHGRLRALFRGRARPPVPHRARHQEPLRADRRDRRVRDDRPRSRGNSQSVQPVRRPRAGTGAGCCGLRRRRGLAAGPGRDSGPGGAGAGGLGRGAPWWAGMPVGSPWCSRCWRPARGSA